MKVLPTGRPSRGGVDRNDGAGLYAAEQLLSPLAWGRGSKPRLLADWPRLQIVAPRVGAWIETVRHLRGVLVNRCRPSRGGVDRNRRSSRCAVNGVPSPLAWGRGSKQVGGGYMWIRSRRPSRGGVDRNILHRRALAHRPSRPSRGGVDRNVLAATIASMVVCRPSRGGVDRNFFEPGFDPRRNCRPSRGGVDRNSSGRREMFSITVAPRVGAWIETGTQPDD